MLLQHYMITNMSQANNSFITLPEPTAQHKF